MPQHTLIALAVFATSFCPAGAGQTGPDSSAASIVASKRSFSRELERPGTFVPAKAATIDLRPEAYAGELLVMEVVSHSSPVNEGEVIARLWTRPVDEQLHQAEIDLRSAEVAYQNAVARAEMDEQTATRSLETARAALLRASRRLEGWEKYELAFRARSAKLSEMSARYGIEDQEDELAQLEKMYREDELTDATEEIVLKRARRNLARSRESLEYQIARRNYEVAYNEPAQSESLREAAETQRAGLKKLTRTLELNRRTRHDALVRSEEELRRKRAQFERLSHDRELFTLRSPRRGLLLHGSSEDYGPGRVPPRYQESSLLRTRTTLFSIVDPDQFEIALTIPETKIGATRPGMAARVHPIINPDQQILGTLDVEHTPSASSAAAGENSYKARVRLDARLPGIVPGMRAKVAIVLEKLDDVIVLPLGAVMGSGPEAHCWVDRSGSAAFEQVPVRLGPSSDTEVVVLEGIHEGDRVLLADEGKR